MNPFRYPPAKQPKAVNLFVVGATVITVIILIIFALAAFSQNIAINTTGNSPNSSAMLDIDATSKGLLIPRVTLCQRTTASCANGMLNGSGNLAAAAQGLVVYQTDGTQGFYYNTSTTVTPTWVYLAAGAAAWSLTGNGSTVDGTNFLGTTDDIPMNFRVKNEKAGRIWNATGLSETFYGYQAGNVNAGSSNTGIGYQTLLANTSGANNVAIGYQALLKNTSAIDNTAIGYWALKENLTGQFNTAVGLSTLRDNTASNNTAMGFASLIFNTSGTDNTAMGYFTLGGSPQTGSGNVAVGSSALAANTSASANTAVGFQALKANTTNGSGNTAIGWNSLTANTSGANNTAVGYNALASTTNVSANTAVGFEALKANTSGTENTAVGNHALYTNLGGIRNTASGYAALTGNSSGNYNTADGYYSLVSNITGSFNTALGSLALQYANADNNTALGYQTLNLNDNGIENTAVGVNALQRNTSGSANTATGVMSLAFNTDGVYNTANGWGAMEFNTSGRHNTSLGAWSLYSQNHTNAYYNTAIGSYALYKSGAGFAASSNTAIGYQALYNNSSASFNTAVGHSALLTNATGCCNTAIGYGADVNASGVIGATAIGYGAIVTANNTIQLGNSTVTMTKSFGDFSAGGAGVGGNQAFFWGGGLAGLNFAGVSCNLYPDVSANWTFTGSGYKGATFQFVNDVFYVVQTTNTSGAPTWYYPFTIQSGGWVGMGGALGTTNIPITVGTNASTGNGATLTAAGAWTAGSDSTKKYDIKNINYGLNEVLKLRPVNYKWKGTDQQDIGFIAQEVKLILPELVYGKEGQMTLSYSQITAVLTKAIQEQQQIIDSLISTNHTMQSELDKIKAQLNIKTTDK